MDINATDMHGPISSVPVTVILPSQRTEASRSGQTSGGDSAAAGNAQQASNEQIEQMVAQMQSYLDSMNVSLQYSFYGSGGEKVAVKVVNKDTGEVIREIPSREMQVLQTKMSELVGMIFNDNA